jgi:hypothetical protein
MRLVRYPGGYMRFLADTSLSCYQGDKLVEHHDKTGAFEQIFYKREIHEESLKQDIAH